MTDELDARQLDRLRQIESALAQLPAWHARRLRQAGRMLADVLRRTLPDLEDLTIGRVVLETGAYTEMLAQRTGDEEVLRASIGLFGAALELTALARQERPQPNDTRS